MTAPSAPQRTAILDRQGKCVNITLLAPGVEWDPGEGMTTRGLEDGSPVGPGYTWGGSGWLSPAGEEPTVGEETDPAPAGLDPDLIAAWQDATTNAQLRAAGLAIFVAAGLVPAPDA